MSNSPSLFLLLLLSCKKYIQNRELRFYEAKNAILKKLTFFDSVENAGLVSDFFISLLFPGDRSTKLVMLLSKGWGDRCVPTPCLIAVVFLAIKFRFPDAERGIDGRILVVCSHQFWNDKNSLVQLVG